MKKYTIGEVFRLGLLKNWKGEPYKDKASISRIVSKMKFETKKTAWGMARVVSEKEIHKMNKARLLT